MMVKTASQFEYLLSSGEIGRMKLRNRLIMPPMVKNYASPEGFMTQKLIDHYEARAKGGIGLAIVEATFVQPDGKGWPLGLGIHSDQCLPGLSDLTEAVKRWGARIAIQLHHAGRQTTSGITGLPVVGASTLPCPRCGGTVRELETEEVTALVTAFAQGARRAMAAGFDAVEIHSAHGYLLSQFLSPNINPRTDIYGGDINGRMTFLLEVVHSIRETVGADYPIIVRMNAEDRVEGGLQLEESRQVARALEAAGVDAIHVSAGTYATAFNPRVDGASSTMYSPRGHIVECAAQIKKDVGIPVIAVNSITPEMAEDLLREKKADFISMGRPVLTDPELPNKLIRGQREDIRPCIRCIEMCLGRIGFGIRCSVNPEVGFEGRPVIPALKPKKVLVVGGGPAGMEAARVAALRGHDVTLFEKHEEIGGHLIEATVPVFKEDLLGYKDWLVGQIKKEGVKVELGKSATADTIAGFKPDAVVIATGSVVSIPELPGADTSKLTTAIDVLLGKEDPGQNTLIVGGGAVGCETALYLVQKGHNVTLVEMLPEVCSDVAMVKGRLTVELADSGVKVLPNTKVVGITEEGVTATSQGGDTITLPADKVVLSMGLVAENALYEELKTEIPEIYLIGDATEPGRVGKAIHEGYQVGTAI